MRVRPVSSALMIIILAARIVPRVLVPMQTDNSIDSTSSRPDTEQFRIQL